MVFHVESGGGLRNYLQRTNVPSLIRVNSLSLTSKSLLAISAKDLRGI